MVVGGVGGSGGGDDSGGDEGCVDFSMSGKVSQSISLSEMYWSVPLRRLGGQKRCPSLGAAPRSTPAKRAGLVVGGDECDGV